MEIKNNIEPLFINNSIFYKNLGIHEKNQLHLEVLRTEILNVYNNVLFLVILYTTINNRILKTDVLQICESRTKAMEFAVKFRVHNKLEIEYTEDDVKTYSPIMGDPISEK